MTLDVREPVPAEHVVQVYERDPDLVAMVGGSLASWLAAGDAAVVVATDAHRGGFAEVLADAGIDAESARSTGTLIELDASELLSRFMVRGRPDPDAFDFVIGGLVRDALGGGRQVRAFGEMVALLWKQGEVAAAIELEELWNALGTRVPFSLVCAYPAWSVSGDHHLDAFADVCHLHSAIVGPTSNDAVRRFERGPSAPAEARAFTAAVIEDWDLAVLVDHAVLVVSELATNAVLHAGSGFIVSLSRRDDAVRIAVRDDSPRRPARQPRAPVTASGRGLTMVSRVARRWGHDALGDGKLVWAELAR